MNDRPHRGLYIVLSMIATLCLHVAFWHIAGRFSVRSLAAYETDRPDQRNVVQSVNLDELLQAPPPEITLKQKILKKQNEKLNEILKKEGLIEKPKAKIKPVLDGLGRDILKHRPKRMAPDLSPPTSPPPKILAIDASKLGNDRLLAKRRMIPGIKRYQLQGPYVPSMVSSTPGGGGHAIRDVGLGMRMSLPTRNVTSLPAPSTDIDVRKLRDREIANDDAYKDTNILDSAIQVDIRVYHEPDGQGYFEAVINVNEQAERIPAIPKDVLILQDSSASIKFLKLKKFKLGVQLALDYLNSEDTFNIVGFREKPLPLFPHFVPPTSGNVEKAKAFVGTLRSTGRTDVYAGLAPYVAWPGRDGKRPYLIFLISDGRTTTGTRMENDELIRRIIEQNRARVSIFSFSAGEDTNLFLMNFLSYKNRGRSLHESSLREAPTTLSSYIGSLSEILVADLRCQITGDLQEEVYPKELPHLFRGHPLTVYGKFPKGTEEVAIQIVGRNRDGKREELLVRRDLSTAEKGGKELATRWAAQKIYHLIAERTLHNPPGVNDAIDRLARKHSILVPY